MLTFAGSARRTLLCLCRRWRVSYRAVYQTRQADCPLREERVVVAREGFEPSKPQGRQIYSLLRLTASLPRRDVSRVA